MENPFKQALDTFGRIDVVVNSARIMPVVRMAESNMETFDKVIAINFCGTFLVTPAQVMLEAALP